ncbi:Ger(x)C family spore germination protein [Salipaludibacillus agaradhaerens]|jgi:spore germination protein KC|uniref:Ger(X)C family spore germination protein n=1 Tax=Salipaludibacillus agaradhaerens TaxID=76935 RepID=A0A9Q4B0D8_SALAG|nr:Ger(x)C family spore germination protein [Salipaludibacillus agaradhaerens]MCR6095846.1 Ger(x)C family spore germination protein [Salipaludibacillus agaradhaerens]MCR6114594.1 Ger(x)C family spore germination protein [Salipaludibacillus agaradhaerens]
MLRVSLQQLTLVILVILAPFLSGCWDANELGDLGIVFGIAIDKADNGEYLVTTQVINASEIGEQETSERAPAVTFTESGASVSEALRRLATRTPKQFYLFHLRFIIISEDMAKEEGLASFIDLLSRHDEMRTDFSMAVARNTRAKDILTLFTRLEKIPANSLFATLELSETVWAPTVATFLDELIIDMELIGKEPVLVGVEIIGDEQEGKLPENVAKIEPDTLINFMTIGAFKEDKLCYWMTEDQSKGFNYIVGNVETTLGVIPVDESLISVEILNADSELVVNVNKGEITIDITITGDGNIVEVKGDIDLSDPKEIEKINQVGRDRIKEVVVDSLAEAQKHQADVFGFGELVRKEDPELWKQLKDKWGDEFAELNTSVNVELSIEYTGNRYKPIN